MYTLTLCEVDVLGCCQDKAVKLWPRETYNNRKAMLEERKIFNTQVENNEKFDLILPLDVNCALSVNAPFPCMLNLLFTFFPNFDFLKFIISRLENGIRRCRKMSAPLYFIVHTIC
uniref:Uncharacterized protein n=1 Tax=Cacopsylla melanoneura TaxID=428564 RepID=A0A8D8WBM4_9HEMI